ncbi:MAG: helix-turn-helix domain-containing protein [Eubacteriales bacterium]|nr:helix-turn-helix domain-containing protein [Eubacteriales bacterium]
MSLQEALKRMRLELGITQADLAQKLGRTFVTVNRWENGKGFPSRENARMILEIARSGHASADCCDYLNEMLAPDRKRGKSAAAYGFPEIDRDFLFQLADGSTNALYVIEAETYRLLYANRRAEKMAEGYLSAMGAQTGERRLSEQTDTRCFHYFGGFDAPCPFCPLDKFGSDEYRDAVMTLPRTGRTVRLHARATRNKGRTVYVIYLNDITQERAERDALYALTNDIPDGVGIYHVYFDGRVELAFMNEMFYRMIGAERKEALLAGGESDLGLLSPDDRKRLRAEIRRAIAGPENVNLSLRMRVVDGRYHTVHLQARLLGQDTEKLTFYCLFRRDGA